MTDVPFCLVADFVDDEQRGCASTVETVGQKARKIGYGVVCEFGADRQPGSAVSKTMLVGHAETAGHLPADMTQGLGDAVLLKSASEIPERIRQS